VDVALLQAADRRVADALAGGRLARIVLFDDTDAAVIDGSQMYRYIEYMTARYAAFPNVIWCLHPTSSDERPLGFWATSHGLVQMLDPYFGQGPRLRVLRSDGAPAS
jgi:hypothetical protein